MSSDWVKKAADAAKQAAEQAAVGAKKLAETAKNANYGEMFDKTKQVAMHAADEAKKAAESVMHKNPATDPLSEQAEAVKTMSETEQHALIVAKLEIIEKLLNEIKSTIASKNPQQ